MAVNQPPIPSDPALASWMLEVTREINELRNQTRTAVTTTTGSTFTAEDQTVREVDTTDLLTLNDGTLGNNPVPDPAVTSVDVGSTDSILRLTNGVLSNAPVVTGIITGTGNPLTGDVAISSSGDTLTVESDSLRMPVSTDTAGNVNLTYNFTALQEDDLTTVPHMLFLGGIKLIETADTNMPRDYTVFLKEVTLNPGTLSNFNSIDGLILELVVFRAAVAP